MERIGVRELRQHASRYLALVKQGHSVEVTDRGVLVARLVPPSPAASRRDALVASGRLLPAAATSGRVRAGRPVTAEAGTPDNAELLDAARADRP